MLGKQAINQENNKITVCMYIINIKSMKNGTRNMG